jgi:hypothetical protein
MISISPDLNASMSMHTEENWSAIACRAFEQRLGELADQKKEKNMEDVIARLKASKQKSGGKLFAAGQKLGYAWARDVASARQLARLGSFCEQCGFQGPRWESQFARRDSGAFNAADRLAFVILGDVGNRRQESTVFWDEAIGLDQYKSDLTNAEFLRGFAEGALDVWEQVESKI